MTTEPLYLDVRLPPGATVSIPVASTHNAFVYAYEGEASVGPDGSKLSLHAAGMLSAGDKVRITAHGAGARLLLLAGRPIGEPIVQYGPFVMNSREEIEQAIADYQSGRLAVNPDDAPRSASVKV
jgi:redox-sensitive bicupin YhaK (pirin superfamily)